jgi:tetrapyrrole methylase family protein/MazG family protein
LTERNRPLITVIGLGPGGSRDLTLAALEAMRGASRVILRTSVHPTVSELAGYGVSYETLDEMYRDADDFESLYREMAARILEVARETFDRGETGGIVYAVPGSPHVGERSVELLVEMGPAADTEVRVLPGVSFLEPVFSGSGISLFDGVQVVDALSIESVSINTGVALAVPQVYDSMVAGRVKSRLMQAYPDEHPVLLARAAGTREGRIDRMCLYEIDRVSDIDHLTTLVVPPLDTRVDVKGLERAATAFAELVSVMSALRSGTGCPWDREQTHESLMKYMVEETYEALDTIEKGDMDKLCEELGDVMLQVVFHAQIASENGEFDIADVAAAIVEKLVRRHPHVFSEVKVDSSEAVLRNWEKIKAVERGEKGRFSRVFDSVPAGLPSLMRAEIVQSKASKVGFDWKDYRPALDKVDEELAELRAALLLWGSEANPGDARAGSLSAGEADAAEPNGVDPTRSGSSAGKGRVEEGSASGKSASVTEEMGDLLFAVVNVARLLKIDPEGALRKAVEKFIARFRYIEERAAAGGVAIEDMTLEEMDELWEESKDRL